MILKTGIALNKDSEMFKISIHINVIRFIKTRKPSEQKLNSEKIELLKENQYNHKELDIKKCREWMISFG